MHKTLQKAPLTTLCKAKFKRGKSKKYKNIKKINIKNKYKKHRKKEKNVSAKRLVLRINNIQYE